MSLRAFYTALLAVFATVFALSLAWEFWLEDRLMPDFVSYYETESWEERWEFMVTSSLFSFLALLGPAVIGTRMIRQDRALRREIIRMSQEDDLTGLFNRRRIMELLENEIRRATRYSAVFSVVLADIDHFKSVNDRLGHQAGDRVLVKISKLIRSRARGTDMVGRWGGEEFLIISPETSISGGYSLAEEIRRQLAAADLGEIGHKTASFGVSAFVTGDDIGAIVARADAGLYKAKHSGRNRVVKVPAAAQAGAGTTQS